jgi:phosphatidylglycerophosphatase B
MRKIIYKIKAKDLHFIYYTSIGAFVLMLFILYIFPLGFSSYKTTDAFSQYWYYITETGSGIAALISILFLIFYLKFYYQQKTSIDKHFVSFVSVLILSLVMISSLSHFVWKDLFDIPRPSLNYFKKEGVQLPSYEDYSELSLRQRSRVISEAIALSNISLRDINPYILQSWISESGYSFPSGHSQTAFFLGVLFSFIIYKTLKGKWKYLLFVPLIWAVLVGMSRVVIGVHYPVDVAAGALLGMTMALIIISSSRFTGIFALKNS